jgi:uncharacterized protein
LLFDPRSSKRFPALSRAAKQSKALPMPDRNAPIELGASFAELERLLAAQQLPPVAQWNPPLCGHSQMRIARDGTWSYRGSPISRARMVRLFSTILKRESDGRHFLVTPVEKLEIDVECTAFRAVEMQSEGNGKDRRIVFRLSSGDIVMLDIDHPLRIIAGDDGISPRIMVRDGLEAELSRPLYYELAEIALKEGADPPGVWSSGAFFALDTGQ